MCPESVHPNPFTDPTHADAYDSWYETPLGRAMDRAQKRLVWRLARPKRGEAALDVGAGTGNYACELARRGLQVVARDPSEAMLAVARAKDPRVTWDLGTAEGLPYEDGRFALVLSVTALEFMARPEQALAEMWRVTAPGGRLVVATLNRNSPWGQLYAQMAQDSSSAFYGARLHTPTQFLALMARLGRVKWASAGFVPPPGERLAWAGLVEAWGRRFRRRQGALLVGRVRK